MNLTQNLKITTNMYYNQSALKLVFKLWTHLSAYRRRQFWLLLILMLVASFAEIVSIGAILPFLGLLIEPDRIFSYPSIQPLFKIMDITKSEQILLPLTIAFGLLTLLSGGIRLLLLWSNNRFSYATGADISINIYRRTLYQPYSVHCSRSSSEIINGISNKTGNSINTISNALNFLSSAIILIAILTALLLVNPVIAMSVFVGFSLIYFTIIKLTRRKLATNSALVALESTNVIKSLQEGLGGIRDVLIDGNQEMYCQIYSNADIPLRRAQGDNLFIASSPRYFVETLGMLLIISLTYYLASKSDGIASAIPTLGALAFGAQRLLPLLQQAYASWAGIQGGRSSLYDTFELLEQPLPDHAKLPEPNPLPFNHSINIKQLSYRYGSETHDVLKDINLILPKGGRIGFIGETGSGKSTLIDILMGLLEPTGGSIEIDGVALNSINNRAWQAHIAHVPQVIFLTDSTVEENIAFGVPREDIDHQKVRDAAKYAQLAETIQSWPKQYKTFVGERGVRLSGGAATAYWDCTCTL